MTNKTKKPIAQRTKMSAALYFGLAVGLSMTQTVQSAQTGTSVFTMYDNGNLPISNEIDSSVTATYDSGAGTWGVSSSDPFFGATWTATNGVLYTTAGTYTVATTDSGCTFQNGNPISFTVGSGQAGGAIKFAWSVNCGIDVVNVWNISYTETGIMTLTSADVESDGVPGRDMIDGPFIGFSASFDLTLQPTFPITLTKDAVIFNVGTTTVSTDLSTSGYTFSWTDNSDSAIQAAMTSANDSPTITFTTSGLTAGKNYTVSVTATRDSDSKTVRADITVAPVALTLSNANDSDGDGIGDNTEGSSDTDGDGIPDFLDSNSSSKTIPVDTTGTDARVLTSNTGTLSLGTTALALGTANLQAGTLKWSAEVTSSDIGSDSSVNSSCIGGCYDFRVTGLSNGGIAKVVIPLSSALPDYPVYRKYSTGSWASFKIDNKNTISSAPALSTGPVTCPAAGSSAYSTVGLTPGDYCIQLTLEDGGPNDADSTANGTIVDPSGVGESKQEIMMADVPNGCSMSTTPVKPTERADWWLVAGFLAALGLLRGMRRKSHAA